MDPITGHQVTRTRIMHLPAAPGEVFPLLCPVREYDWISTWACELIHCPQGASAKDCVFTTELAGRGRETWTCTKHEAPGRVEYIRFSDQGVVTRTTLTLAPGEEPNTTMLLWETLATSVGAEGKAALAELAQSSYSKDLELLEKMLAHYLSTGQCLNVE